MSNKGVKMIVDGIYMQSDGNITPPAIYVPGGDTYCWKVGVRHYTKDGNYWLDKNSKSELDLVKLIGVVQKIDIETQSYCFTSGAMDATENCKSRLDDAIEIESVKLALERGPSKGCECHRVVTEKDIENAFLYILRRGYV